jgi:hypothetical protein
MFKASTLAHVVVIETFRRWGHSDKVQRREKRPLRLSAHAQFHNQSSRIPEGLCAHEKYWQTYLVLLDLEDEFHHLHKVPVAEVNELF